MNCVMAVPQWRAEEIFLAAFARSMRSYQEPSGPLYIAATLIQNQHSVILLDGALRTESEIVEGSREFGAGFVGMYVAAPLWKGAMRLTQSLKEALPDVCVGIGGPWASGVRERCLEECPELDVVFVGEGEHSVPEVVAALEAGRDFRGIEGVIYRDRATGEIVANADRPLIADLDELPFPARHLMGDDIRRCTLPPGGYRRTPVAHLIGSRGCTNRCIYCYHLETEPGIRYRSPANMIEEMRECIERYGFREIRFLDDNFTGDRERVLEFCELLRESGLEVPWYVSSRIDTVDKEMLVAMKQAGCWAMLYGIESGVQKNLDALRKNVTLDQVRQVVSDTKAAGIKMFTPFMFGIPGETFEEGLETIRFACELDPYYANFNTVTPFPGTELWDNAHRYGTLCTDTDRLTFQGSAFVPHTMTAEEIEKLRQIAFRKFYSRPRFMLRWLLGIRTLSDLLAVMKGGMSFLVMWLKRSAFHFDPEASSGRGEESG